jgi:RNA polymerase sigma factor (sigma-70 family)
MQLVDRLEPVDDAPGWTSPPGSFATANERVILELEANQGQGLSGFAQRMGLSDSDAADAVQTVLLRLWSELQAGVVINDPRAWAYRATYRVCMDQHRVRRRITALWERLLGPSRAEPGDDETRASTDRLAVWSEVDHLPARQREVLYLRYRSDLPFEVVGQVLGITSSAARSHATQALATLRRRIGPTWHQ